MARPADRLRNTLLVMNPDEDCSIEASQDFFDEILNSNDEPIITSLDASEVLRRLRSPDT